MKNIVLHSRDGRIESKELLEGELEGIVKMQVTKATSLWNPSKSDMMVFMTKSEASLKAPLTPATLEMIRSYSPVRRGAEVVFNLPIYVISYEIEQVAENNYKDKAVFVIAPYVNEELGERTQKWAQELTGAELESQEVN